MALGDIAGLPPGVTVRAATAEDHGFEADLFVAVRPHLAQLPLPEPQRAALVAVQHRAQRQAHRSAHPGAEVLIVELEGTPMGRLHLDRSQATTVTIVDIAVLPAHQGTGIGSALLAAALADADATGRVAELTVAAANVGAQRLYARLGFTWEPSPDPDWRCRRAPVS